MTTDNQPSVGAQSEQAGAAPATGTTATASTTATEQGKSTQDGNGTSTAQQASAKAGNEEVVFFDPKSIEGKPELEAAYREMRGAFTKKSQEISKGRQKIEAYDAFMQDPVGQIKAMAAQYGLHLTPAQARAAAQTAAEQSGSEENWEPKSWNDVFTRVEQQIMGKLQGQLSPVFDTVKKVTASNIEKELDGIDPQWRLYEDDMMANIKAHPTLVSDVAKLYRMSMPEDVIQSRATQAALRKLEEKGKSAQVHGAQGTPRTAPTPKKAANFNDAVEQAKASLASQKAG